MNLEKESGLEGVYSDEYLRKELSEIKRKEVLRLISSGNLIHAEIEKLSSEALDVYRQFLLKSLKKEEFEKRYQNENDRNSKLLFEYIMNLLMLPENIYWYNRELYEKYRKMEKKSADRARLK